MLDRILRSFTDWAAFQPTPGDLCTTGNDAESYSVVKVLAVTEDVVHVRLYKERFAARPKSVFANSLTLGRIDEPGPAGMGHLPLSRTTFANWRPIKLHSEPVTMEELEGYRMWQVNAGGVW